MDYNKLWSLINSNKLTKSAAARIAGMTHQGFKYMMERNTMTADALEKFAIYFKVPISHFFEYKEGDLAIEAQEPGAEIYCCKNCGEKERTIEAQRKTIEIQEKYILSLEEATGKKDRQDFG